MLHFSSSVTANSTIFFPPSPQGLNTMIRSVLIVLSSTWKWLLGFSVPPFISGIFLCYVCFLFLLPRSLLPRSQSLLLSFLRQMLWKSWSSGGMWCITHLKVKIKAIAARLCFLRHSENYSSVIWSGTGIFWSAHLCTSIHLNMLMVNPFFLT